MKNSANNVLRGGIEAGITYEMEAWSESMARKRMGMPAFWSTYTFDTLAEAQRTRARLEKRWAKLIKKGDSGEYKFKLYKVERTEVARPKRRSPRRNT